MAQPVTLREKIFVAVSSHAMAIRIGHRGRATSFFWGFVKSRVYANKSQTIPELKVEIRLSLAKVSRNYADMSSRVSSKEQECASRVVGDICRILCSTISRSVCTLY